MTPLDRTRPPARQPAKSFSMPPFERRTLGCGVEVLCLAVDSVPLVHTRLLFPAGGQQAPADLPGLPSMTAALLDEGTRQRSGPELAEQIERLGGYLGTGAGWDSTVIETEVLGKDLGTGLELLAEVAREPSFPDEEVTRVRRQLQTEIKRREAQPSAVASRHFNGIVFHGTVYGEPLIGTHASLEAIDRDRASRFQARHLTPAGATLVAVGRIDPDEFAGHADKIFAGWSGPGVEEPQIAARPQKTLRIEVVDRPDGAQTEIRVGHLGIARTHPRYLAAAVLSCLLGGKFTSRLNLNLRERRGFTYGVRSAFGKRKAEAPFVVSTALATEHVGEAISEIFAEIQRLRDEAPSDAEVADTRDYLIGSFPYSVETLGGLASRLSDLAVYGLGDDYYVRYAEILGAISGSELLETARELLDPERSVIVCVGPAAELVPQLEARFDAPITVVHPQT